MRQPALGLVASAIVIALALAYISLFDFEGFTGWGSYVLMCLIPFEIVAGVCWGANPGFASKLSQPVKGIVLVLVCAVAGAIIGPLQWQLIGGGLPAMSPMLMQCTITSVVVTFTLAIIGARNSTAAASNGVDMKSIPTRSQCALSATYSSRPKWSCCLKSSY